MGNFAENLNLGNRVRPPPRQEYRCVAFTDRGQPEIRQIGRALGRRPAGVRHN